MPYQPLKKYGGVLAENQEEKEEEEGFQITQMDLLLLLLFLGAKAAWNSLLSIQGWTSEGGRERV